MVLYHVTMAIYQCVIVVLAVSSGLCYAMCCATCVTYCIYWTIQCCSVLCESIPYNTIRCYTILYDATRFVLNHVTMAIYQCVILYLAVSIGLCYAMCVATSVTYCIYWTIQCCAVLCESISYNTIRCYIILYNATRIVL